jgi:hypothetical protein
MMENDKKMQEGFLKLAEKTGFVVDDSFMNWLVNMGFFIKPASISFHGQQSGDLFRHSFAVADVLIDMTEKFDVEWERPQSPFIVGMFHDVCKMDDYMDENASDIVMMGTGSPVSKNPKWVKNPEKLLKGHGDKSVMMLSQWINLTEEEMLCIRYHMGAYQTDEWQEWDRAIRKYETVLWTHTADMYASKVMDI